MLSPAATYPVKANGRIFFATPERVSYALDAKTGKQLWRAKGGRESIGLSPDGNAYYIKTMKDTVYAYSTKETYNVVKDGVPTDKVLPELLWAADAEYGYEIGPTPTTSIAEEGRESSGLLFVATDKGDIVAMSCSDGSIEWKHRFGMALINYIQPLGKNRILVSSMDGFIGVLEY